MYQPTRILIERRALDYPLAQRVIARSGGIEPEVMERPGIIPRSPKGDDLSIYNAAKRILVVGLSPKRPLRGCRPSADFELPLGASCPGRCVYCYLQSSQGARPYVRVYADLDAIKTGVDRQLAATYGELSFEGSSLSDPIAVEHLTGSLAEMIPFFGLRERASFRLVTKFAWTEGLIGLAHAGRTRIRFSLNTPHVVGNFEAGTDPVAERIEAANRLGLAGYPVGFVLAPLMLYEGWERDYQDLLAQLAERLRPSLAEGLTFELISHRFTSRAREIVQARFPQCRLDLDETKRQIKWGRYGRQKFVYPRHELQRLWDLIRAGIESHFPAAVIEYST